ncbi:MAG: Ribosomal RNA small subunit methyltransferase I [Candidatus Moranbacteria bacterium GW2011_GWC2_37_73]|nr:MAG: Ribosomal RNA small subunit methyltransferase I [Parcubacteria group bacterium GW2011_GWC1_36_108]KKQ00957.1 MAG: Ribosomal RNA small subunit methyltransferase I [Candidatus Moranbacteria bacterium GW2011_GWD2_36_198]KKQ01175.1 MAG: Ribosomal RNA small subunit methyltransferase I [Candidatus Moranbacteria bacterium GW2011_GWD1_36_198]KKQ40091.1 MAG: Ribosomal RNA small subunit methyltransferase I [Candidatus Moranbacteria bacterium GW2011_GWC2_37_73]
MKAGILFIVATPIGNLEDITLRALRVLKEVDMVACEDTRVTRKLLNHYSIETQAIVYHQHTKDDKIKKIIDEILAGKNVAVVTDAGTPGVSDPGNILVAEAIANSIVVLPIPGASALASIISVAGIDMQQFTFLGFPPHKKGRETYFKKVEASEIPVIYYESPHRVIKNLTLLLEFAPEKKVILGRELTKMFEEVVRGSIEEVLEYFSKNPSKIKGEFVIVVY